MFMAILRDKVTGKETHDFVVRSNAGEALKEIRKMYPNNRYLLIALYKLIDVTPKPT